MDAPDKRRGEPLWSQVHALDVLAQAGSFTQAAQRLGLSKAAVSQRIAGLERHVGTTLVQRTTRSMRLTDAGQQLVDATTESYAAIERSVATVRDLAGEPRGVLRVTAPVALGRQQVAPLLAPFLRAYPGIRVELDLSDRLASLAREGYDLAIRHTAAPPDSHVAWKLCTSRTVLVATAGYLRRHGVPAHPSDLATHAALPYLRTGPTQWRFERTTGRTVPADADTLRVSVGVQGPLRANNSEVLRDAILAGLGIGLLPDFSAAAGLRSARLREVLPQWRPTGFFGDAIYAIRPWSPTTPRPVRAFVEHLQRAFAPGFFT